MQVQMVRCLIFGPNGAGKHDDQAIDGILIFPTTGSAQILGRPVSDVTMHPGHWLPARAAVFL